MKEEEDRNKRELSEFQRYVRGEMTKRQENAFQRKLQRDPFAAEAAEGLETLKADEAMKDLSNLERRLNSRISRRKRYIYYRIAASVAIMMIISSVFFFVNRKEKPGETGEIPAPAVVAEKSESGPVSIPEEKTSLKESELIAETVPVRVQEEKKGETGAPGVTDDAKNAAELISVPLEVKAIAAAEEQVLVAEKVEAEEVPAAAAKEDAVVEYQAAAMDRKAAKAQAVPATFRESEHVAPEPITGKNDFEKYLRENIRIPAQLPAGDTVMVEVSIIVTSTGQIKSIRIIDSPGEDFSNEARRLIEEGPAWNPAKSGGTQVEDSVRLKILFRR